MKGLKDMSEKQDFIEMMNDWGFSVNARINFNNFISAVETEDGLISRPWMVNSQDTMMLIQGNQF